MRIDGRVCQLKFVEELRRLEKQSSTLKKRGIFVHKSLYPVVEVVFIFSSRLKLTLPVTLPPGSPLPPGISIPPGLEIPKDTKIELHHTIELPNLSGRAFGARISLDDFDQRAPSVVFSDPFTWEDLPYAQLHRGQHAGDNGQGFNVLLPEHPSTKKPFLCMRGIREYHEHPQHTGDDWMLYRQHVGLFSTIDTIWRTCVFNANPNLILKPPNINVHWAIAGAQ